MIHITWADASRTLIRTTFLPGWTWDTYHSIHQNKLIALLNEAPRPVNLIGDLSRVNLTETVIPKLPQVAAMGFWHHPNLEHVYLYGATGFVRVAVEVFTQVYGGVSLVKSEEEALKRIKWQDGVLA